MNNLIDNRVGSGNLV